MGELKYGPTTVISVRIPETTVALIEQMLKSTGETKGQFVVNAILSKMNELERMNPNCAAKAAMAELGNAKFLEQLKKWLVSDDREESELAELFTIPEMK